MENKKPSHIWFDEKDIYFDYLIVKTDFCEAIFTLYGDVAHCWQSAVRYNKDRKYGEWNKTNIAKHCGELESMLKIADETIAFLNGDVVYHSAKK